MGKEKMYIYEMHQHTSGCSACGAVSPQEMVESVKESGFSGVVITNHFYNGNSAVDRSLSWEDFCSRYKEEYLLAKEAGDALGVDVIYGLEEGVGGGKEVLIYGVDPDLIGKHPALINGNLEKISKVVRNAGGLVIQAHPFRQRGYIAEPDKLLPQDFLDGYEVYNKGNSEEENEKALALANKTGKIKVAGSDCHNYRTCGRFGIACPHRIRDEKELVKVLKNGEYELYLGQD